MGTRATPQSYYYSGQGRLLIGDREASGRGVGFVHVGNVPELSLEITSNKVEHQESMTGSRNLDTIIINQVRANIKFKAESLSLTNLALGLYGVTSTITGATVAAETKPFTVAGQAIPLNNPKVSAVTVKVGATEATAGAGTTAVLGTDYLLDTDFGVIYPIAGSAMLTVGKFISVAYTFAAHSKLDALTQSTPPEKYLRFEGFNTVNGDGLILEVPRVKLDPLSGYSLITNELANADFTGNALVDTTILTGSQVFTERVFALP